MAKRSIAILGAGCAGLTAAEAIVRTLPTSTTVTVIDRRPVARIAADHPDIDRLLADPRIRVYGGVEVASDRGALTVELLRTAADAVIIASGSPADRALGVPGEDLLGVVSVDHLEAWMRGRGDPRLVAEDVDSVALVDPSPRALRLAELMLAPTRSQCADRSYTRLIRQPLRGVHLIQHGAAAHHPPAARIRGVAWHQGVEVISVVGRRRARAVRLRWDRERGGMRCAHDIRAQLVVRPEGTPEPLAELDVSGHRYRTVGVRAQRDGEVLPGVYVVGWARRPPDASDDEQDAAEIVAALLDDLPVLPHPQADLDQMLSGRAEDSGMWSTTPTLDRSATGPQRPLPPMPYSALLELVDDRD